MKSTRFHIKSNYIKNAQKEWVLCEGKLMCHNNITFLHLKSANYSNSTQKGWQSELTIIGRSCTMSQPLSSVSVRLNVLCNLCEFKSCDIKSVNFNRIPKFAIKLVPSGLLTTKKIYLITELDDDLMEWCTLFSRYISNPRQTNVFDAAVINDRGIISTHSTLKSSEAHESSFEPRSNQTYVSLDDNDAYSADDQNEFHVVSIEPTPDSEKLYLKGDFLMQLGTECLYLLNVATRDTVHEFPNASIRRFGAKGNLFRLEAGRRCSTGIGTFTFKTQEACHISEKLKENCKQVKMLNNTLRSSSTISRSTNPNMFATNNDGTKSLTNRRSSDSFVHSDILNYPMPQLDKKSPSHYENSTEVANYYMDSRNANMKSNEKVSLKPNIKLSDCNNSLDELNKINTENTSDTNGKEIVIETKFEKALNLSTISEENIKCNSPMLNSGYTEFNQVFSELPANEVESLENQHDNDFVRTMPTQNDDFTTKNTVNSQTDFGSICHTDFKEAGDLQMQTNESTSLNDIQNSVPEEKISHCDVPDPIYSKINHKKSEVENDVKNENDSSPTLFEYLSDHSNDFHVHTNQSRENVSFPKSPTTVEYKVSDSTFFRYRQQKPSQSTEFFADPKITSFRTAMTRLNSIPPKMGPPKKPPPVLPKPSSLSPKGDSQSSFREFDELVKSLNKSFS